MLTWKSLRKNKSSTLPYIFSHFHDPNYNLKKNRIWIHQEYKNKSELGVEVGGGEPGIILFL